MTRRPREGTARLRRCLLLGLLALAPRASVAQTVPPPFDTPLSHAPLAGTLILNDGFGDYRGGHFHAGFDLGTSRRVGRAVIAPAEGRIERVRTSGVGYGRSLYLRLGDGRLLQFGHLDAFAGPVAAYAQKIQDSSGVYEQDLWPEPGRFRIRAGETIAWTGQSGAGGPHLHFEIRRGDMAYNPMRAGLRIADRRRPALVTLTLEPLDDSSSVQGRSGPYTLSLAKPDTIRALGRLRAVVGARDRFEAKGALLTPWSVGIEWMGRRTECRLDSASWATDMPEAEYVYDAGRVIGRKGIVLWSPAGFRPRVLISDSPLGEEAGALVIRPGDPPRTLRVWARDLGGGEAERTIVVRPEGPPEPPLASWWHGEGRWKGGRLEFTSLPGGGLRLGAPLGSATRGPEFQVGSTARRATRTAGGWCATFALPESARLGTVSLPIAYRPPRVTRSSSEAGGIVLARRASPGRAFELADSSAGGTLRVPADALFEEAVLLAFPAPSGAARGLTPVGGGWCVEPETLPLRRGASIELRVPANETLDRVGLCRFAGGRWRWVGAERDSVGRTVRGTSRDLGQFALFRDEIAPRIAIRPPAPPPTKRGAYSRWALEATLTDEGSGIDARASWFEVDGRRVPSEWDPEAGRLRWRPAVPPGAGNHEVLVVSGDRAGNEARVGGHFHIGP